MTKLISKRMNRSSSQQNLSRKRPISLNSAADEHENPLKCKICLRLFTEPYITICGHTFCQNCIVKSVQHNPQCPICDTNLDLKRQKTICPNHTVASLIEQQQSRGSGGQPNQQQEMNMDERILQMIRAPNLSLDSVKRISDELKKRQLELELNDQQIRNVLLHDFLDRIIEKRECASKHIQMELDLLKQDKQRVLNTLSGQLSPSSIQRLVPDAPPILQLSSPAPNNSSTESEGITPSTRANSPAVQFNPISTEQLGKYRRRLNRHMASLESAYFGGGSSRNVVLTTRESEPLVGSSAVNRVELDEFSEMVRRMYQYGDMKLLATLNYNFESTNALSIVSSIEFDKDGEFFVIAGVTKKIKLYNYESVVNFDGEMYYPEEQLVCNSKISNVSWNPYIKNMLASSDYEGTVQLWDTNAVKSTRTFREHEKRCWTVQFNNVDPHLMASGSDDGKVKLWALNAPQSVCTIDAKVNVCCVYFSPKYRDQLVFGSSDHCVHLYDIRKPNKAVNVFRGHRKAVSYVKYCNANEVVSASTDSNLRVWDVNSGKCLQTMRGHQNEKNFVGLATDGTHVVCGSENNRLYLYYKMVQDPLLSFDCATRSVDDPPAQLANGENGNGANATESGAQQTANLPVNNDFVSAVCWKKNSNVILAANSQGQTFVLQLQ